ncbi:response regulator [Gemmatimonadota bacterium]
MSKIRVLLVDDEEDYVRAMAERMVMRDLQIHVALSGEEALEHLEDNTPDVIVLDLRMPGMHGMDVLECVRREHPHIQVIILTGHGGEKEEEKARRLGAFEYIQKPADTSDLVRTIQRAWKRSIQVAKEILRESREEFDRSMTAAALAEGGMPEEAREMMKPRPSPRARQSGGLKVLLVDDEEDYIRTIAERLEIREMGSDVALDGEQALAMLEEDPPDVMVLDLKMPGLGGMAVLERVKRDFPQIQVIIMTGHGSEKEEAEARRLGVVDYIEKPVDIRDLMERVRKAGQEEECTKG